ncbi:MAG: carbamate kinase [Pseudomonadota bacterium]|nr:carbamate kinase [Pseudomonadota bacterium]
MKLLVALGGNALLQRGQAPSAQNQSANINVAADQLARVAAGNGLVVTHGNGPQIGLLALQAASGDPATASSLDTLGAETDGLIGYLLEQSLANRLPPDRAVATLLTRVEVDPCDPAFAKPSKPIGPIYAAAEATRLAQQRHWVVGPDGSGLRRLVASPQPQRILGLEPIRWLIERGAVVIAAGGGGIPVALSADGRSHHGVEAVIDKDACSALLAQQLGVDCFVIATDVTGVSLDWGTPQQREIRRISPQALARHRFAAGSMGPKVDAACAFALATGRRAMIGSLGHIEAMLAGQSGTEVCVDAFDV